tara:strand:- start:2113 stop:2502 length:390 start_codon:yes stop_codon:yes gene_type:complete
MASQLKVDTITGVSTAGSIAVTGEGNSTTTNLQQGLVKAWAAVDGTANSLLDSFNTGSVTDNGTGSHTINYTNVMSNANYATQASHKENQYNAAFNSPATGSVRLDSRQDGGTLADIANKSGTINGDLA